MITPREDYDHPGPLGPALDLSRVTGWDIHHTAGSHDESAHDVAQTGVNRFGRSSYNFHIPSDGAINEMQGLHIGAHNDGENSTRLGVVFPGYFHPPHNHMLTKEQIDSMVWLMRHGHEEWGIPLHAKGHRATDQTSCPGDNIVPVIPTIVAEAKNSTGADMTPEQAAMLAEVHRQLTNTDVTTVARRVTTTNLAVGRMEKEHGPGLENLAGGGSVDYDLLADKVADKLAARLAD